MTPTEEKELHERGENIARDLAEAMEATLKAMISAYYQGKVEPQAQGGPDIIGIAIMGAMFSVLVDFLKRTAPAASTEHFLKLAEEYWEEYEPDHGPGTATPATPAH